MRDRERAAELFSEHAAALGRYARARVGAADAEDVVAATFLRAYRARDSWNPSLGSEAAWLFGIASNEIRNHRRSEQRRMRLLSVIPPPMQMGSVESATVERIDAQRAVARLVPHLQRLHELDRDILLLNAWAGLSPTEIAQALGMVPATVRTRLRRTRERLRRSVSANGSDNDNDKSLEYGRVTR